eukprot:TRINITY_DN16222_c0_g1_i1.p1 TRINITY_DN16222_c0_g1~~TRINITY_DN16222_c0_g1_i1.p1  ORF type:complete len:212 (+),score=85.06 TRINITY_DN16222_c0_g1_i1:86-721(+)
MANMATVAAMLCLSFSMLLPVAASDAVIGAAVVEQKFNAEVRGYAGKTEMSSEMPAIRKSLEPHWLALPKTGEGRMVRSEAQVLLQRFFLAQHELEISDSVKLGDNVAKSEVPAFLLNLVEEIFGDEGLLLHELSLVAATFDSLLKDEALWTETAPAAEEAVEMIQSAPETLTGDVLQTAVAGVAVLGAVVAAFDAARRFGFVQVSKGKVQ